MAENFHAPEPEETSAEKLLKQFAIALKLDENRGLCPQITAKARGNMVTQLLELARKNNVPIEESPALLEGLKFLDVGQHAPEHFFPLIAELLTHVESIRRHFDKH